LQRGDGPILKTRVKYKTQEREREREREFFLWKLKYFTMQKYNLQKNLLIKETKILQAILELYYN
jgi:hypothetical protein